MKHPPPFTVITGGKFVPRGRDATPFDLAASATRLIVMASCMIAFCPFIVADWLFAEPPMRIPMRRPE